ncbi:MAG: regulatory protein RecX [Alphaproteobacteria bacterium]|nr:MAG: regulatory protein RecX [Alphaproteobacteria bacterium]
MDFISAAPDVNWQIAKKIGLIMSDEPEKKAKRIYKPKEPTSRWLRDAALRYLNRFPATTMKLRQHLLRKASAGAEMFEIPKEEILSRIDAEIGKLVEAGILNDKEFAASKARVMARDGKPVARISLKLKEMGFSDDLQDHALAELGEEGRDLDLKAAARYVRKRKFGPFKPADTRAEREEKELASLARTGFSFDVARRVLDAETTEEIEALIRGEA